MIVFKTYLKILNKNKMIVLFYSLLLLLFTGFNMQTSETSFSFTPSKPDIYILLEDEEVGVTKNLVSFLENHSNRKEVLEDANDALFYRDVNMIIHIPKGYRSSVLNGNPMQIEFKSTGDYQASLMHMLLQKYSRVQNILGQVYSDENELIQKVEEILEKEVDMQMTTKLDTSSLSKAKYYYNFSNYAILAGLIYVVCFILLIFREENIKKRTTVSSMNYRKFNRILFFSNSLFAVSLWFLYVLFSFFLVGNIMFQIHGLLYIFNSFLFTLCALSLAFFIGNIISNKEAMNGIVNVVALGSSFLCGAFVPVEFLPDAVVSLSKILPSYWFIHTNEILSSMETIQIQPLLCNFMMLIFFTIFFFFFANVFSRKNRIIGK